jgi:signal transduction histidine kinase/CheY-like chemotaxis protein
MNRDRDIQAPQSQRPAADEIERAVASRTAELSAANTRLTAELEEYRRITVELRHEEGIRRKVFEAIPDMLTVIDRDFRIVHSNWGGGYDYVPADLRTTNPHCYDAFYPGQGKLCEPCHVAQVFATGKPVHAEKVNPRIGHVEIRVYPLLDAAGNVIMAIEHIRDISEQKKLEEERIKSQKLESLGVLAGGIAHDFNNLLTGILGNISLARSVAGPESKISERLLAAEQAALRAGDLTQQLLTFSRGGAPIKKAIRINDLLEEAVSFALRGSNVSCRYALPACLWLVSADSGQLNQVFNNLVINADQAMPDGGTLIITAENCHVAPDEFTDLPAGQYVKISLMDSGAGIAPELLDKIFDPYFTTKASGTGLGLATVYSIITKHGGRITVESTPGSGTTFHLLLPAAHPAVATASVAEPLAKPGQGTILVMDDELLIREVARQILEALGYTVQVCRDGGEALQCYQEARDTGKPIDVVIMDLTIPGGMGGKEAAEKLLTLDPTARVIVSSGYATDPILANFRNYGFCAVALKPYNVAALSNSIQEAFATTADRVVTATSTDET